MSKKTLVLGASPNPARVSYEAVQRLTAAGHEVIAQGIREGSISGIPIERAPENTDDIDTVTLYLNPQRQEEYYDYILGLAPKRIVFNPGTENPVLAQKAKAAGIETEAACTLVLLSLNSY